MDNPDDPLLRELHERLERVCADLDAKHQRLDEIRQRLASVKDEMRNSRERRDISHSAYAELEALLDKLPVIEQAKGILMARTGCSPIEALDMLRSTSRRTNVPISEVASDTVKQVALARQPQTRLLPQPRPRAKAAERPKGDVA